jgi:hypothetical protein
MKAKSAREALEKARKVEVDPGVIVEIQQGLE